MHPDAPTAAFNRVILKTRRIHTPKIFGRIHRTQFPAPLGYGHNPSRFSDPQIIGPAKRFGVLYLGRSLEVCFLEAVLRDLRNGAVGDYPLEMQEFHSRAYSRIVIGRPLKLVDLTGDHKVIMGIRTDVTNASDQTLGRLWAEAIYLHPAMVDGILYQSRLSRQTNLAIFDRAVSKLTAIDSQPLLKAPELPRIIDKYKVAIIA